MNPPFKLCKKNYVKTSTFLFGFRWCSFANDTPDGSQAAKDALKEATVTSPTGPSAASSRSVGSIWHVNPTVKLAARLESDRGSVGWWGLESRRTGQGRQRNELGAVGVVKTTGLVGANRTDT